MAKVTPVLWKHKKNADGHHPIYIRVADARRTLYVSLGEYIAKRHWNPAKRRVRKGHPNADDLNDLIASRLSEAQAERVRLKKAREPVTAEALKAALADEPSAGDFFAFADAYVDGLRRRGQIREHRREKTVLTKLRAFTGEPLPFERITPRLLRDYETHLVEEHGNKPTTVNSNFRVIRTLLYKAIREGHYAQEKNPFFQFTPMKASKPERPKLSLEQVRALEALDLGGRGPDAPLIARVRDYFLFSLYAAGVRFGDVAGMRCGDVTVVEAEGEPPEFRLSYTMGKTGKRQALRLVPQAVAIARPYLARPDGTPKGPEDWLFPILEGYDVSTPTKLVGAVGSQNALVNKYLKEVAKRVAAAGTPMPAKISFHIARHSFADIARRAGWDVYAISQALAHSGLNVTEHYLAGFDREVVDGKIDALFGPADGGGPTEREGAGHTGGGGA